MIHTQIFYNELCDMWFIRNGEIRLVKPYRAKVIDNKDPLNQNRIKVFIPELMKNVKGIWARPLYDFKKVAISPQVGDIVLIIFENGNIQQATYIGHVRLSCPTTKQKDYCGTIEDKDSSPNDYWVLETPLYRRLRLSDSKNLIQLGNYQTKRIFEINDNDKVIIIQSQNTNRVIKIDDSNNNITIQTSKGIIQIDDNASQIKARIGNSSVVLSESDIQAKCGNSIIYIDDSKVKIQSNVIMLN